jgi:hypothetical protein
MDFRCPDFGLKTRASRGFRLSEKILSCYAFNLLIAERRQSRPNCVTRSGLGTRELGIKRGELDLSLLF